jgi:hypothetical protein
MSGDALDRWFTRHPMTTYLLSLLLIVWVVVVYGGAALYVLAVLCGCVR